MFTCLFHDLHVPYLVTKIPKFDLYLLPIATMTDQILRIKFVLPKNVGTKSLLICVPFLEHKTVNIILPCYSAKEK